MRLHRLLCLLALLLSTLAEKGRDFYKILCVRPPDLALRNPLPLAQLLLR